ncbi:MAG: hypothetical protein AAB348_02245 [Patescibacteria group bacterium]
MAEKPKPFDEFIKEVDAKEARISSLLGQIKKGSPEQARAARQKLERKFGIHHPEQIEDPGRKD